MRFTPPRCKAFLQDWVGSAPSLSRTEEVIEQKDKFCYLDSYISPGGRITDEVSASIQRAQSASVNLRHLWRRRDIRVSVKDRMYAAAF
ncbi:unnamed protein product [Echinostoma caproni]|uniref:Uncharacterized protein n=1 Tax=Echinostoma caproni TaxID=27848 RepID=A0A183ALL2_9TREM|nr:unnamed protein product [Echinostoma caproni]